MEKSRKFLSQCISVILALALVIGICPRAIRALTDEITWFTPSNSSALISSANISSWWSSAVKFNEIANNGGWHFEWSTDGVGVRQGITKSFPLSGLTLKFDNLENETEKPSFSILMLDTLSQMGGNMDPVNPEAGGLALFAVDIADGEIRFENDGIGPNAAGKMRYMNDGTVLLKNDKIKYDNLKGKEFAISFHGVANGAYEIWVDIENEQTIKSTQNLTAEMIKSVKYFSNLENIYVGVSNCRGNTGTTKLDFTAVGYPKEEEDGPSVSDWYIPKTTSGFISEGDVSSWWSGNLEISNLPKNGGIRWKCQHNGVGIRQGWKQSFALDGLSIKFDSLENPNGKASFLIYLSDSPSGSMDPNASGCMAHALIAVDTADGEIRFENTGATTVDGKTRIREDGTVLVKEDLLKYASLEKKEFIVSFTRGENAYNIEVKVGDENVVCTNALTDEMLGSIVNLKLQDRVYVGIGNNNGNEGWTTLDITGIGPMKKTDISRKELTIVDVAGDNWWPEKLSYENSPTGGLRYSFKNSFRNIRLGINDSASLNGMYLKLNNITKVPGALNPRVLLVFSKTKDDEARNGMFAFLLDTDAGTFKLNRSRELENTAESEDVLITSDSLKYNNIVGRTVIIRTFANENGGYNLSLRIGNDAPLECVITAEMLSKSTGFTSYDNAYLTIQPGVPQNAGLDQFFSVDIVEYWSSIVNADMVINAIEEIGEASLENAAALRNARALYEQLPNSDKTDVSNFAKLQAAEAAFKALAAEADKDLIFMNTGNAKLSTSSDPDVLAAFKGWSSMIGISDLENGGLHYNFSGAGRNIREGYAGNVDLSGLYLQFDRFASPSAENAKFALMIGNGNNYGIEYSETRKSLPLTLVLDPSAGNITCFPKGDVIISDDMLKLENLTGERFSYHFDDAEDGGYKLTVKVGNKSKEGNISNDAVIAASSLSKPDACEFMVTPWESSSTFSLDVIGYKQTKLTADEVMALIDSIGLIGIDSGSAIEAALNEYDSLSNKAKMLVENYDTLVALNNYYLSLDFDTMIFDAETLIDEIGTVGFKSGKAIRDAKLAYDRLNAAQRARVSNASVLEKAISAFDDITSDKIIFENYAYPINARFTTTSGMGSWWANSDFSIVENKTLRIDFKDAIRDVRNGPNTAKELDGLVMRIANITPDAYGDGTGTKLSIQMGSRDNNYRGGVNLTAFALVLDTYEGAIYGYPGNRLVMKDDMLKQANIAGKQILIRFDKTEEKLFRMEVKIGRKSIYSTIPSSLISNSSIELNPESVFVALSPWVDNIDGLTDNSLHSFSVDFLSCQSTGKYAFEDLFDLLERIEAMPETITVSDEDLVMELSDAYRELPRVMRAYVDNYSKLCSAINQVYELNAEDTSAWDKGVK